MADRTTNYLRLCGFFPVLLIAVALVGLISHITYIYGFFFNVFTPLFLAMPLTFAFNKYIILSCCQNEYLINFLVVIIALLAAISMDFIGNIFANGIDKAFDITMLTDYFFNRLETDLLVNGGQAKHDPDKNYFMVLMNTLIYLMTLYSNTHQILITQTHKTSLN
jgi:nitrate reductase NapE component